MIINEDTFYEESIEIENEELTQYSMKIPTCGLVQKYVNERISSEITDAINRAIGAVY